MAHTLSAKKRIRQNINNRALNRWRKRQIHDAVRDFESTLHAGDFSAAQASYVKVVSILDKVACKGTIHRNKAARHKSQFAKRLNSLKATS